MFKKVEEFLDMGYSSNTLLEQKNRERRAICYANLNKDEKKELFHCLLTQTHITPFLNWFPADLFNLHSLIVDYTDYLGFNFIYDHKAIEALYYVLECHYEDNNWDWADIYHVREELVKHFIKHGFDVNHQSNQYSFLHSCIANIQCETLKELIEKGANLNRLDPHGQSVLMCALEHYENTETFSYLFSQKNLDHKLGDNILSFVFDKNYFQEVINIIMESPLGHDLAFLEEAMVKNPTPEKTWFLQMKIAKIEKEKLENIIASNIETKKLKI